MNIIHDRTVNERVLKVMVEAHEVNQAIVDWAMRDPSLRLSLDTKGLVSAAVVPALYDGGAAVVTIQIDMEAQADG
ncbi:hypothetical protein [EBPR siphovirus 2]|nr:hypothetical protein [EBPR siphovirus 2]